MSYRLKFKQLPRLSMNRMKLDGSESAKQILETLSADYLAVVANLTPGVFDDEALTKSASKAKFVEICLAELLSFKKPQLALDYDLRDIANFSYGFDDNNEAEHVMTLVHKNGTIQPLVKVSTYEPVQNSLVIEDAKRIVELSGGKSRLTAAGVSPDGTKFEVSLGFGTIDVEIGGVKTQIRQIAKLWSSHDKTHAYSFAFSLVDAATSSLLYWNVEKIIKKSAVAKNINIVREKLAKHTDEMQNFIQEIQVLSAIPVKKESPKFLETLKLAVPHEKRFDKVSWDMRSWLQGKISEKFTNFALDEGENAWVLYKACNEFLLDREMAANELEEVDISVLKSSNFKKQLTVKEYLLGMASEHD